MNMLRFKLYAYRNRLVPMLVLVLVPWIAIAPFAPWWGVAISAPLLLVCAWLIFLHVLPMPPAGRRASDAPKLSDVDIARMRQSAGDNNAQQLLNRWASVTKESKLQLEEVDQHVTEVMSHAETAVIEIGKRFVEVTRKTRKQVELAVALLSRNEGEGGQGTPQSLTDYIHACDALLKSLGEQLLAVGGELASLSARQEQVREDSKRIDGALDQLTELASQIRVLALDSGRRGNADNRAFVEMTDRVRSLSLNADDATRAIRKTLEEIKTQARQTDDVVRGLAQQARDSGRRANERIAELTGATLKKSREVDEALGEIGSLGERIQADINQIVIELQFQDITQQKLQRLKQPMLTELASSWLAMFEETRAFNRKLSPGGEAAAEGSAGRFRVSLKDGAGKPAVSPAPSLPGDKGRDDGNKVELF